jgi:uncharacterized membrane-anchored protein YitT (DUF2179 family)
LNHLCACYTSELTISEKSKKMTVLTKSQAFARLALPTRAQINKSVRSNALMLAGILLAAFGYAVFQIPHKVSAGGIGTIALILNNYVPQLSIGMAFWLLNIPMITLGFFTLGRWQFAIRTLIASTLFASFTDLFGAILPNLIGYWPLTDNMILNVVYAGLLGGLGGGIIYKSGASTGGTGVVALIVQRRTGLPLSTVFLLNDGLIIFFAGVVFGWEAALYSFLILVTYGYASDFAMEGPSSTRTATIVTNSPERVANALMATLNKGVSYWEITGGYTGQKHFMVTTTMLRSQVDTVQHVISEVDPDAFVTIGMSQKALGHGFRPIAR